MSIPLEYSVKHLYKRKFSSLSTKDRSPLEDCIHLRVIRKEVPVGLPAAFKKAARGPFTVIQVMCYCTLMLCGVMWSAVAARH